MPICSKCSHSLQEIKPEIYYCSNCGLYWKYDNETMTYICLGYQKP